MTTFVLVHGAWHGGWCWQRVASRLRGAGHDVVTPTLTGLGGRVHLAPADINLTVHVEQIDAVLRYEDLSDVLLAGHSYGGMVITGVAGRAAERLAHLVYLDAFVPEAGQALIDLIGEDGEAMRKRAETTGGLVPPLAAASFGVTDRAEAAWVESRLVPQPFATFSEAVGPAGPAASRLLPRTYIRCTRGSPTGPFAHFARRARISPEWRYQELATGHDAMVTMPQELADALLACAVAN
ncbi:MAG: alpha/beta fold hydrolase [Chloroflexi bacterium]|nr:alpha/beta fold hydrolase [Chloroflexota bacterium]